MLQRCGSDEAVFDGWPLAYAQSSPSLRNTFRHWKNEPGELGANRGKPALERCSLGWIARRDILDSFADFADGNHAQIAKFVQRRRVPGDDAAICARTFAQFGDDVGIEEEAVHSSSSIVGRRSEDPCRLCRSGIQSPLSGQAPKTAKMASFFSRMAPGESGTAEHRISRASCSTVVPRASARWRNAATNSSGISVTVSTLICRSLALRGGACDAEVKAV